MSMAACDLVSSPAPVACWDRQGSGDSRGHRIGGPCVVMFSRDGCIAAIQLLVRYRALHRCRCQRRAWGSYVWVYRPPCCPFFRSLRQQLRGFGGGASASGMLPRLLPPNCLAASGEASVLQGIIPSVDVPSGPGPPGRSAPPRRSGGPWVRRERGSQGSSLKCSDKERLPCV